RSSGNPEKNRLGFHFDALPVKVLELVREKKLDPIDGFVLMAIIRFRQPSGDWAWASHETLAEMIGRSTDAISRSAKRLQGENLIDRHRVPIPDPDCRANRTGWRWRFLFVEGIGGPSAQTRSCKHGPSAQTLGGPSASVLSGPPAQTRTKSERRESRER